MLTVITLSSTLVPAPLERRIAWPTLRIESGIAVGDEDLDEQRMDLVYSVRAPPGSPASARRARRMSSRESMAPAYRAAPTTARSDILETSRAEPATLRELLARQVGRDEAEDHGGGEALTPRLRSVLSTIRAKTFPSSSSTARDSRTPSALAMASRVASPPGLVSLRSW